MGLDGSPGVWEIWKSLMSVREFCSSKRFEGGQALDDVCAVTFKPWGEDEVSAE